MGTITPTVLSEEFTWLVLALYSLACVSVGMLISSVSLRAAHGKAAEARLKLECELRRAEAAEARLKLECELRSKAEVAQAQVRSEAAQDRLEAELRASIARLESEQRVPHARTARPSCAVHGATASADGAEGAMQADMPVREDSVTRGRHLLSRQPSLQRVRPSKDFVAAPSLGDEMANICEAPLALENASPEVASAPPYAPADGVVPGRYAAFVSHFKSESAMEARFVQNELEQMLGRQVFLE